eukprot:CAMPEP_0178897090 /NCGR_PEP_ID=MMETSP0786-20121207/1548_1 /TAXON_ID=186022 /ORGANISM="Thalassionema frauenfeldii, Strain CCMP 1798" /LENGTH=321 /DNA_ID=CAMNT_0020567591 /DNA_START=31 /DNA_END=996 /DNA_ORIENTATION=+
MSSFNQANSNDTEASSIIGQCTNFDPSELRDVNLNASVPYFFFGEYCPFANYVWIALLEKEKDPSNPQLFHPVHVCKLLGLDPGLSALNKQLGLNVVPALLTCEGQILAESAILADYVDVAFAPAGSLSPSDVIMRFNMNFLIERHSKLSTMYMEFLLCQDSTKYTEFSNSLLNLLGVLNADLKTYPGPYLLGEQFTLADINIFVFVERIKVVLGHFRSFVIPASLDAFWKWYRTTAARPSVQVVLRDRSATSMQTYSFQDSPSRNQYLIATNECFSRNEYELCKKIIAEKGSPGGSNVYRQYIENLSNSDEGGLKRHKTN